MNWQHFKQHYLIRFWPPLPAVIAAGVLSTYYFGITGYDCLGCKFNTF